MYCYSWDIDHAAGYTTSGAKPYGALLSRTQLPAFVKKTFEQNDWLGTYDMNYDGWKGALTITSLEPVAG
jgi:hypothetical protein